MAEVMSADCCVDPSDFSRNCFCSVICCVLCVYLLFQVKQRTQQIPLKLLNPGKLDRSTQQSADAIPTKTWFMMAEGGHSSPIVSPSMNGLTSDKIMEIADDLDIFTQFYDQLQKVRISFALKTAIE